MGTRPRLGLCHAGGLPFLKRAVAAFKPCQPCCESPRTGTHAVHSRRVGKTEASLLQSQAGRGMSLEANLINAALQLQRV